jgi:hypothetical protein
MYNPNIHQTTGHMLYMKNKTARHVNHVQVPSNCHESNQQLKGSNYYSCPLIVIRKTFQINSDVCSSDSLKNHTNEKQYQLT